MDGTIEIIGTSYGLGSYVSYLLEKDNTQAQIQYLKQKRIIKFQKDILYHSTIRRTAIHEIAIKIPHLKMQFDNGTTESKLNLQFTCTGVGALNMFISKVRDHQLDAIIKAESDTEIVSLTIDSQKHVWTKTNKETNITQSKAVIRQ